MIDSFYFFSGEILSSGSKMESAMKKGSSTESQGRKEVASFRLVFSVSKNMLHLLIKECRMQEINNT